MQISYTIFCLEYQTKSPIYVSQDLKTRKLKIVDFAKCMKNRADAVFREIIIIYRDCVQAFTCLEKGGMDLGSEGLGEADHLLEVSVELPLLAILQDQVHPCGIVDGALRNDALHPGGRAERLES